MSDQATLTLDLPAGLTEDLQQILGFICYRAGPIAHAYARIGRYVDAADRPLPARAEHEQAFVIHRMLVHLAQSGPDWREAFLREAELVGSETAKLATEGGERRG